MEIINFKIKEKVKRKQGDFIKAILVKRIDDDKNGESIKELEALAKSANYEVVDIIVQRAKPNPVYQIGRGKILDIAKLVKEKKCDKIIFDNLLTPVQSYNISKVCGVEAIDRLNLILEVFALRAGTREAKLQVELAKLSYELPKAKMKVKLAKRGEQPGFRGLGTYEADVYELEIKKKIHKLKEQLAAVAKEKDSLRMKRRELGFDLVTLAGYTNAGKTTLLNALTNENARVSDELFTTLVPKTRKLSLDHRNVLLTDTVGFIRDLPPWLIEAFHSTLTEIYLADVILLVVDISDDLTVLERKLETSLSSLRGEVKATPIITVLNKCDLIVKEQIEYKLDKIRHLIFNPVLVSAKQKIGIEELKQKILQALPPWRKAKVILSQIDEHLALLSWLFNSAWITSINFDEKIEVEFQARDDVLAKINKSLGLQLD
jgi:GTP-binding protein HflX